MANSGKVTSGPYWTQNWIEAMWRFTSERFVNFDTGAVDYEALGREEYEFRKALFYRNFKNSPRAKTVFDEAAADYSKKVQNGSKGGRPKKSEPVADEIVDAIGGLAAELCAGANDSSRVESAQAGSHKTGNSTARRFSNKQDFMCWAIDAGLDPIDAGECWDATAERGGKDGDGNRVNNMEAFAKQWCRTRAKNRRTA